MQPGARPAHRPGATPRRARAGAQATQGDPAEPVRAPATHRDLAGRWALFHRGLGAGSPAAAQTPRPGTLGGAIAALGAERGVRPGAEGGAGRGRGPGCPSAQSPPAAAARRAREASAEQEGAGGHVRGEGAQDARAAEDPARRRRRGLQETRTLRQETGILTKHSRPATLRAGGSRLA